MNGLKVNEKDKCIYYKLDNNTCIVIYLYIDGLLIFDSNNHDVNVVKSFLSNNFYMKYL